MYFSCVHKIPCFFKERRSKGGGAKISSVENQKGINSVLIILFYTLLALSK